MNDNQRVLIADLVCAYASEPNPWKRMTIELQLAIVADISVTEARNKLAGIRGVDVTG